MAGESNSAERFYKRLLLDVPEFQPVYDDEMDYYEELLPILMLAEFARFLVKRAREVLDNAPGADESLSVCGRSTAFLEWGLKEGGSDYEDYIYTGFLEGLLTKDEEEVRYLVGLFGPQLSGVWTTHFCDG